MSVLLLAAVLADAAAFVAGVPLDGPEAAAAVPRLIEIVRDEARDEALRQRAADRLARIGEEATAAVPVLVTVAEDEGGRWAVKSLATFGPLAVEAAPLYERLASDPELGQVALEGLSRTLPRRPSGLGLFQRLLLSDDLEPALDALSLAGGAAQPLVPLVSRVAEAESPRTQRKAIAVLRAAGGPAASATLGRLLLSEEPDVFADAAEALAALRRPDLLRAAFDSEGDAGRRRTLARSLASTRADVRDLLEDEDSAVRLAAAVAIKTNAANAVLWRLLDADRDTAVAAFRELASREVPSGPTEPSTEAGRRLAERLRGRP